MTANGTAAPEKATARFLTQLFKTCSSKDEALNQAVELLLQSLTPRTSAVNVRSHVLVLSDLDQDLLIAGLSEAMETATGWVTPGQLYDICMGGSRADLAAQEAEEAWAWMLRYIQNHGKDGHVKRGALIVDDIANTFEFGPDTPAPAIPEAIANVLGVLGGTPMAGVERIALTPTIELGWVKKEFVAGYVRAGRLG